MKTKRFLLLLPFLTVILMLVASVGAAPVAASADSPYLGHTGGDYLIESYDVEMNISADRTIDVKEVIAVVFATDFGMNYNVHGITRSLPLEGGVRYLDFDLRCDNPDFSPYTETDDSSFITFYLRGDGTVYGQKRTYTISYRMISPVLAETEERKDKGYLSLDVIGYCWRAQIMNMTAKITVPDGLEEFRVYSGTNSPNGNLYDVSVSRDGNVFTLFSPNLSCASGRSAGVTFDMSFAEGALGRASDPSIWIALLCGAGVLAVAIAVGLLFCRPPHMTTTINLTAPEEMDPLLMGQLIDNRVDSEDLGALVFYLAEQGYLTIDLSEGEDDPILQKTDKPLPPDAEKHIAIFYNGLFEFRDRVSSSELKNAFYHTAQSAAGSVKLSAGKIYKTRSYILLGLIAVLTVLTLGGFTCLYSVFNVFRDYYSITGIIACTIGFATAAAFRLTVTQHRYKWGKGKKLLFSLCGLIGLAAVTPYPMFPNPAYGIWTFALAVLFSALSGMVAGGYLTRTEEYTARLGQILGFKQFILVTEKDRIEFMLKENPALYYHILPYAQVLGVTDVWTEKFDGLDLKPPSYLYGSYTAFDFVIWNHIFFNMNRSMSHSMVSRPSSAGRGYNHSGGFGGGFGGGGIGGGGGGSC